MCRETEGERQLGGTDIVDTLPSVQPPERKGVGAKSPKPPNVVLSLKVSAVNLEKSEQQRAGTIRESTHPSVPRKTSAQSPRLLPYFPKPGVTSPPPPQSLARHSDLPQKTLSLSPGTSSKSSARSPSPAVAHRAGTSNICSSPSSHVRSAVSRSSSSARNPSPAPAAKATSSASSKITARNPSPGPSTRVSARNPSPTPAPRISARNPSPGPISRATPRNPSPVPSSRASARSASPAPSSSKSDTRAPLAANSPRLIPITTTKSQASTKRSASPALPRKDTPRSVSSDNGNTKTSSTEPVSSGSPALSLPNLKLPSIKTSHKSGPAEVNMLVSSRSLAKSFKNGAILPCSLDTLAPIVKKPTPTELQAQKKERISGYGRKVGTPKAGRVACEGMLPTSPVLIDTRKRCHWVTPQSEAELVHYHDEVWGVPVHDDKLLFELLVLEGAQAELSRPQILGLRDYFREVFGGFDPAIVANFDERKIIALKLDDIIRQPEAKLRGVIENAKQILKIIDEFGSFDKYLWSVVGFKPIVNAPRIFTQIPVKSSKSEALSKDLMRRGFRYVGPTTVYSFMQAAGMVNDHLATCFRHSECSTTVAQTERVINGDGGKKAC